LPKITSILKDAGLEALDMIAPQEDFNDTKKIAKILQDRANLFGDSVTKTTLDKLDSTLADGIANGEGITDLSDRVSEVYDEFPTYRSDRIARTETTYANAVGSKEGWRQSGVANANEWINSGDDLVRDEHQDEPEGVGGEIVLLDDDFSNGYSEPCEPNCRCVLGPAFLEDGGDN
jgi:SPP1 gp7 family putative phage head morphogenesis protein